MRHAWSIAVPCLAPEATFVAIDFETTGLSPETDDIIEIAAIRVEYGTKKAAHYDQLVRPGRKLPPRIVQLTGIDDGMLDLHGIAPRDAISQLVDFIAEDAVVAYNAPFDIGFLRAACVRHGVPVGTTGSLSCALALARRAWPHLRNHKLGYVADRLGLESDGQHRALADAIRAAKVYRAAVIEHLGLHAQASPEALEMLQRISPGSPEPPPAKADRPARDSTPTLRMTADLSGSMSRNETLELLIKMHMTTFSLSQSLAGLLSGERDDAVAKYTEAMEQWKDVSGEISRLVKGG